MALIASKDFLNAQVLGHNLVTMLVSESCEVARACWFEGLALLPGAILSSRRGILKRTMSGFMELMQSESVLISKAPDFTEGQQYKGGWDHHLGLCSHPRDILNW